jgi:peptidoglycan-associated lipoprotein
MISISIQSLRGVRSASLSVLAAAAMLAACSSVPLENKVPVETRATTGTGANSGAGTGGAAESKVTPVDLTNGNDGGPNAQRIVYFDFDSYAVKEDYRPMLDRYAKLLAADRKKHLAIEGHTDERGGSEYNLALGQKRAEAVQKSLALLGASDQQMESVSFGKERPAVQGSDEAAWAKNRRAELIAK